MACQAFGAIAQPQVRRGEKRAAYLELPAVSLLRALEENLHSSVLLRDTFGCGSGRLAAAALCLLRWRRPPALDASDRGRSKSHTCTPRLIFLSTVFYA